ncbi:monovalent cation/H(+) antiporter subunit G [Frankia sp. CNm7]|uniref:Monovalent cation/H(+) antiporter subunit G n=1 Tax=Frankia nepalensis TaxID=1836974 RepID=A0A937R7G8_9ACTN|nr:monovalent cation/H(+) antiporter subunit G [Frankia nepalensis]MBL7495782.1 monovalent cation/H(+) antiporter subunit G [Frankia nepalensis]MBL7516129.1 monovalent cation/H(+) antiporter subunit G [Frankia nepalensis]MBL7524948.1 monovalent cation/H(+) antiporter subunit G [Frankia nepalensis]MBL7627108.1 monovalent cation/H(+) antiporter subunit G [Frankia nepalensis]
MNGADVATATLMLTGAVFCVLGSWGLRRFPDVPSRLQAATKPQTIGLLSILAGAALQVEPRYGAGLALVGLLQLVTAPVVAQRVSRAAYRTGRIRHDLLLVDDLASHRGETPAPGQPARPDRR